MDRCLNCNDHIRLINYAMGKEWMHVNPDASFPSQQKGTAWRHCQQKVAEPDPYPHLTFQATDYSGLGRTKWGVKGNLTPPATPPIECDGEGDARAKAARMAGGALVLFLRPGDATWTPAPPTPTAGGKVDTAPEAAKHEWLDPEHNRPADAYTPPECVRCRRCKQGYTMHTFMNETCPADTAPESGEGR